VSNAGAQNHQGLSPELTQLRPRANFAGTLEEISQQRLVEIVVEEICRRYPGWQRGSPLPSSPAGPGPDLPASGPGRGVTALPGQGGCGSDASPTSPCHAGKGECTGCGWSVSRRPDDARKIVALGASRLSARPKVAGVVPPDLARTIDHTLLKAEATREDLDKLCEEAARYGFASVCVNPTHVRYCYARLAGTDVMVVTVVGFPLGATSTAAKVCEARKAVEDGASEIDMVLNIGLLKSRDYETVVDDIARVVKASHPKPVKVILETSSLSEHEKVIACALSKCGGAHFVKTSTGFGGGGATAADVALMKAVVGEEMEVKASGGIKSYEDAVSMIEAGATRIGASASVVIVAGPSEKRTRGRKRPVASGLY